VTPKLAFLTVAVLIVLLPWLAWRVGAVRRVAPLAVVQILVGVLLGPSWLGRVAPELHQALFGRPVLALLDGVATVGVLLYVLCAGLHLDLAGLRRDAPRLAGVALGSVAVPLLLGVAAGAWMLGAVPGALGAHGERGAFLAAVAICIAVTALPVLAAVLQEIGMLHSRLGQTALALAALNDAALWVMLAVLLAVAGHGGGAVAATLGGAGAWFAALFLLARPLMRRVAPLGETAVLVAGVALALLSAAVSEALDTGAIIGAFAAGVALPASCRAVLLSRLEAVSATVLLPFFFMSTGLKALIEPGSSDFLALLLVTVAATVLGKVAGTALPARRAGFSWAESLSLGAMMQTKGLMEVVVLAALHDAGLIGGRIFSAMVAMAVVCTVLTGPVVQACRRAEARRGMGAEAATLGDSRVP
jgi:Kef-type K+ transport system membrane component KefB